MLDLVFSLWLTAMAPSSPAPVIGADFPDNPPAACCHLALCQRPDLLQPVSDLPPVPTTLCAPLLASLARRHPLSPATLQQEQDQASGDDTPGTASDPARWHELAWQALHTSGLSNALLALWHSQESREHSTELTQALHHEHWGHASLALVSLFFHLTEGLEHGGYELPDLTALSDLLPEWINSPAAVAARHMGWAGTGLLLALAELVDNHDAHHDWLAQALGYLHTAIHLRELWQACHQMTQAAAPDTPVPQADAPAPRPPAGHDSRQCRLLTSPQDLAVSESGSVFLKGFHVGHCYCPPAL